MEEAEGRGGSEKQPSQDGDRELTGEMASGESRAGVPELFAYHLSETETSSSRRIDRRLEANATKQLECENHILSTLSFITFPIL